MPMLSTGHRTILTVAAVALLTTGCSTSRFGGEGLQAAAPQRLPAAPSGQVSTGSLAPPVTASGPGNIQELPQPPQGTELASADPVGSTTAATPPAGGGGPVSANALIGNWSTTVGGSSCATFFSLSDLGSGKLGGTRGCQGDLAKFRTWRVAGNSATLRDSTGNTIATLTKTGDKSFAGTTSSGQPFTLTR